MPATQKKSWQQGNRLFLRGKQKLGAAVFPASTALAEATGPMQGVHYAWVGQLDDVLFPGVAEELFKSRIQTQERWTALCRFQKFNDSEFTILTAILLHPKLSRILDQYGKCALVTAKLEKRNLSKKSFFRLPISESAETKINNRANPDVKAGSLQ